MPARTPNNLPECRSALCICPGHGLPHAFPARGAPLCLQSQRKPKIAKGARDFMPDEVRVRARSCVPRAHQHDDGDDGL